LSRFSGRIAARRSGWSDFPAAATGR
jgi:hypothetical protein